jgi:hypothetical protein
MPPRINKHAYYKHDAEAFQEGGFSFFRERGGPGLPRRRRTEYKENEAEPRRQPLPIELDHTIVPSRHAAASAKLLAELLCVPWAERGAGPFSPVYVNEGLTLDFIDTDEAFPIYHFCFRVSQAEFDAILGRIEKAGIAFRSSVRGPVDGRINTDYGGSMVYWNEPDGHQWEMLTVSYARRPE